jgi:hypothetical protein
MKINILILVLFCWPFLIGIAQNSTTPISFKETTHDFGEIKEANGEVEHTFIFTNITTSDLIVQDVKASCGCTTPEWTQQLVKTGEEGFIKVVYDPENRPGEFNKTVTVLTNLESQPVELCIKGNVIPIPRSIEEEYPIVMGGLRVQYRNIILGKITTEKPFTKTFTVYNDMHKAASWENEIRAADHISVKFSPKSIPAKSFGTVEVTYDPRGIKLFGYKGDKLEIETNEWFNSTKNFRVIAFLEEYFPPMTSEELAQAPTLIIENPVHDFGKVRKGMTLNHDFKITNTGKDKLNIRMTRASCGCTAPKPDKNILKPGESSTIQVTYNTNGKNGNQSETIFVFSNDPSNPTQKMTINANVISGDAL